MTEVQRLFLDDLATRDGDTAGWAFFDGEDFWVSRFGDARWMLIKADARGNYAIRLDVSVTDLSAYFPYFSENHLTMAWDGVRLAVAAYQDAYSSCDFCLAVFGADGLRYLAAYGSSLNTAADPSSYAGRCRPMDYDALKVEWADE